MIKFNVPPFTGKEMDYIRQAYPGFDAAMQSAAEPDGELCR